MMTTGGMLLLLIGLVWVCVAFIVRNSFREIESCRQKIGEGGDPSLWNDRIRYVKFFSWCVLGISLLVTGAVVLPLLMLAL